MKINCYGKRLKYIIDATNVMMYTSKVNQFTMKITYPESVSWNIGYCMIMELIRISNNYFILKYKQEYLFNAIRKNIYIIDARKISVKFD